jgi:threonine dehydrogenase-like Zn-dependent dehydrogenase
LPRQLITHRVPFRDFHRAFELALDRRKAMKVLIHFE